MEPERVRAYHESETVVEHYREAAARIGLWKSEEKVFTRVFKKDDTLLECGCGAGRIALGLWELGYKHLLGVDYSKPLIQEARRLNKLMEAGVAFKVCDLTKSGVGEGLYEGAIFGFNGLMTIPGDAHRRAALGHIHEALVPGAWFVFTTHDRLGQRHARFWAQEKKRWEREQQDPRHAEYGDRCVDTPLGELYVHVPTPEEVRALLKDCGFRIEADVPRTHLADEPLEVREFADDCRFWVARKV